MISEISKYRWSEKPIELARLLDKNDVQKIKGYIHQFKVNKVLSGNQLLTAYRLWSAVKWLFGQSDWQLATKTLAKVIQIKKIEDFIKQACLAENYTVDLSSLATTIYDLPREILSYIIKLSGNLSARKVCKDWYKSPVFKKDSESLKFKQLMTSDKEVTAVAYNLKISAFKALKSRKRKHTAEVYPGAFGTVYPDLSWDKSMIVSDGIRFVSKNGVECSVIRFVAQFEIRGRKIGSKPSERNYRPLFLSKDLTEDLKERVRKVCYLLNWHFRCEGQSAKTQEAPLKRAVKRPRL